MVSKIPAWQSRAAWTPRGTRGNSDNKDTEDMRAVLRILVLLLSLFKKRSCYYRILHIAVVVIVTTSPIRIISALLKSYPRM